MDIFIDTENSPEAEKYKGLILKTAEFVIESEGLKSACAGITLTDNNKIRELNKQYRQTDRETDCLSFPQFTREEIKRLITGRRKNPRGRRVQNRAAPFPLIGDIVISFEKASEQAGEYGHGIERELAFLTVHSCLHLFGYDHLTEGGEAEMFGKQEVILSSLGYIR